MALDLTSLTCFMALADTLHFGRAASQVHLSQPALSQRIRRLEEVLGARLLTRTTRRVQLTAAGLLLQRHGRALLHDADALIARVQRVARGELGHVRIGFVGIATVMGLPERLRAFRAACPEVVLELEEVPAQPLLDRLGRGTVDVGIVRTLGADRDPLASKPFADDPYWLAVPTDHPLSRAEAVPVEALHDVPLMFFPRPYQPELHDRWLSLFARAGITPRLTQEIHTLQTEQALVAAGLAVALCPASTRHEQRVGICYRPLVGTDLPRVQLEVVWDPTRIDEAGERLVAELISSGQAASGI